MSHRFSFPSGRVFLQHLALLIILISTSHCQKKDETPPPPKASEAPPSVPQPTALPESAAKSLAPAQGEGSTDCCEVVANAELKDPRLETWVTRNTERETRNWALPKPETRDSKPGSAQTR